MDSRGTRSIAPAARVLVVDDDDAVRQFVKRILDDGGYVVEASASGADALTRMRGGEAYDLIVADVCMPEMTGPQLVARMRKAGSEAKVLYVTGFADQLFEEHTPLWAGEAYLDKPCTVQGLREAVSLLLHGKIEGDKQSRGRPRGSC